MACIDFLQLLKKFANRKGEYSMSWLTEMKKASKSNAGCGIMIAALFVVPGIFAIILGEQGVFWGILFLGIAAAIAV